MHRLRPVRLPVKTSVEAPIDRSVHEGFLNWRGHTVYVTETGRGDPLLLLTGLGGNTEMWAPFMEPLQGRRVIRFDAPGTGRSSTPMYPVSIASLADLAAAVLDDRDVPSADVVGFSYGGFVAQQLAHDHPRRIRRLVLAATTCGGGSIPGSPDAMAQLTTPLRYYSPGYFERTAATVYGGETGRNPSVRRRMMAARHRLPPTPYGYAMQLLGMVGWSSWPFLDQITHDTLVISGGDDPLVPVANAKLLASRIPHATLEIVENGGHLLLWDDAEHLGRRIRSFVDPVPVVHPIQTPAMRVERNALETFRDIA